MNIKSLLLGSAAALVAATTAQAADAIVAPEPEAVEYVRVCDAYGAGFFYIPGTETCLKISGMVRYQINAGQRFKDADGKRADGGWGKLARAEIKLDARGETEMGTLRSYIVLRGNSSSENPRTIVVDKDDDETVLADFDFSKGVGSSVGLQHAIIALGGLEMGLSDTLYDNDMSGEFDSGGGDRVHFMRYTFAGSNGFSAAVALEEADKDYDYTPNVVGHLGVTQGWGNANLYAAYDATAKEAAFKAIGRANVTDAIWLEGVATYETGSNYYGVITAKDFGFNDSYGQFHSANLGAKWSAGGLVGYKFNDKLSASIGGQYFKDVGHMDLADAWSAGLTADYQIVPGFDTKLAVNYLSLKARHVDVKDDAVRGFLRFQRSF